VKNYKSLLDVPEPVDYVLIAVPRGVAPRIIGDCIRKGVGGASLFTSGFAETHSDEGARLQETLIKMARDANLNLIGPNCMGIFNRGWGSARTTTSTTERAVRSASSLRAAPMLSSSAR